MKKWILLLFYFIVFNNVAFAYATQNVLFRFGLVTDTHYYSEPYGEHHPLDTLGYWKIYPPTHFNTAWNEFNTKGSAFNVVLGDIHEDNAGWPGPVTNAALSGNTGDLMAIWGSYPQPVHIIMGNHDKSYNTTRSNLYSVWGTYATQENFGDYANRWDYTFDYGGVRFIAMDNVNADTQAGYGYLAASSNTLTFLTDELSKVETGGMDEGMSVVIMTHARIDCTVTDGCTQKQDLLDTANFKWTASAVSGEFYLEDDGGGSPTALQSGDYNYMQYTYANSIALPKGTIGSLTGNTWNFGNNPADSLGFDTIYIRLPDGLTPAGRGANYIQHRFPTGIGNSASTNFDAQQAIITAAASNGAAIKGVLQGHFHSNAYNLIDGVQYITFKSWKNATYASYALIEVLEDHSLVVYGYGDQDSYNVRDYYVDCTNGSNSNPGTFVDLPFKTLAYADEQVPNGNNVNVVGTCVESWSPKTGASGFTRTWTFKNAVIDANNAGNCISLNNKSYITIQGSLTLINSSTNALSVIGTSSYISVSGITIGPNAPRGILYSAVGSNNIFREFKVINTTLAGGIRIFHASGAVTFQYFTMSGGTGYSGIVITGGGTTNLYNFVSADNVGDGIGISTSTGTINIENGIMINNTHYGLDDNAVTPAGGTWNNSYYYNNTAGMRMANYTPDTNVINADPVLWTNYKPKPNSPVIDTGSTLAAVGYTDGTTPDLAGVVHNEVITNVTDVKPYTGTSVDIGAYEQPMWMPRQKVKATMFDFKTKKLISGKAKIK